MTNSKTDRIELAHGGGGRLSHELIISEILPRFQSKSLAHLPDAAGLHAPHGKIVVSTDSFVVQPLFFPGGNIGDLAVYGTVNDLAVSAARPRWLSLAMIIEEGFELEKLRQILNSIRNAAQSCGVEIVTGDTKVVHHGQADGLYLNTTGIGEPLPGFDLHPARVKPGDVVLASGSLAEHGVAVMTARSGINIKNAPPSDTASVYALVEAASAFAPEIRFMRDPTRGGLAGVLNELAAGRNFGIEIDETKIPLSPGVKAVCEMLGLEPVHIPSEGRLIAVCSPEAAPGVLTAWRALAAGAQAAAFGRITSGAGGVALQTASGGRRLVDWPQGELLPRIC
jgi:hydrogenase expression/formation protein HypE